MSDYTMRRVHPSDRRGNAAVDRLLADESIRRDAHLDYTCALFDEELNAVATGSCFGNTLRCLAVSHEHQGEGLMNEIITHLVQLQFERGNYHLFLYTKVSTAKFFRDLGFYEIVRIEGEGNGVVFMENRRTGFADYLKALGESQPPCPAGASSRHGRN
ncbi:MAG: GNAT family N-acetyltransferase [Fretibacterium sp.]|nr:GNAT family N-acetyltransferase [Fretibacterium sp.]